MSLLRNLDMDFTWPSLDTHKLHVFDDTPSRCHLSETTLFCLPMLAGDWNDVQACIPRPPSRDRNLANHPPQQSGHT